MASSFSTFGNVTTNWTINTQGALQNMTTAINKMKATANGAFKKGAFTFGSISGDFSKFRDSVDSATARVLAFTATTTLLYGTAAAFKRLTSDAIKVEAAMVRIGSITGTTGSKLKEFQQGIFRLANETSTSFEDAAAAAEEFSRQGYNLNQTLDATKAALAIAKLSGENAKSTIEGLTATIVTFGDKAGTFTDVAGKLLALDTKFATSAAGIIQGLTRVAGVAQQAGFTFDETASALTALKQETGRSEAVLGNSLKSILTSLQSDKVIKDLRAIGVEVEGSDGSFRNMVDVVRELSKAFDQLNDSQQASITQKIANKYQSNAFVGLLKAFRDNGNFDKALKVSGDSKGQLDKRLEAIFGTSEAGLQRLSNKITEFGAKVGSKLGQPIADAFAKSLTTLLDSTSGLFEESGKGIGDAAVAGIVNVIKGPGAILLGAAIFKLFQRFSADAAGAVKSLLSINVKKEQNLAIDKAANALLVSMTDVERQRIANLGSVAERQKAITAELQKQFVIATEMGFINNLGFSAAALSRGQKASIAGGIKAKANRATGSLPERMAIYREEEAINKGVGGARSHAKPKVIKANLGKGQETVVVNTDEKVIRNFAGSGQDAILNREMMGYAGGKMPSVFNPSRIIKSGGTISRANKPTLDGIRSILKSSGINSNFSNQAELESILAIKGNKKLLYKYLRSNPISVSSFPGDHHEIADGNHRYYLASMAGIKNIPTLAQGYIFHGYQDPNYQGSEAKDFKRGGYIPVTYDNIAQIAEENKRKGIKPRIIDPIGLLSDKGYRADVGRDSLPKSILENFSVLSSRSLPLNKYEESVKGGLQKSVLVSPSTQALEGKNSINAIIAQGRKVFGNDDFFIKSTQGAQGEQVFTPGQLFYDPKTGSERKSLPENLGQLYLQKSIPNAGSRELRVHALQSGNKARILKGTAYRPSSHGDSANDFYKNRKFLLLNKGLSGLKQGIGDILSKKIAELQLKRAIRNFNPLEVGGSLAGADVLETGNKGISKLIQYLSLKTGLNFGKQGGGVVEYNFAQKNIDGALAQPGASGALLKPQVLLSAGSALERSSKKQSSLFVTRGKEILKQSGADQSKNFLGFYKDLLKFKAYDKEGYLKTVKKLGKAGFGVTAGRGASKRFISYKNLADGFIRENREIGQLGLTGQAKPMLTTIDNKPAIVNSMETVVRGTKDQVIPNYATGTPPPSTPFGPTRARVLRKDEKIESKLLNNKRLNSAENRFFQNNPHFFSSQAQDVYKQREQTKANRANMLGSAGFAASFIGGAVASRFTGPNGEETTASRRISGVSNALAFGGLAAQVTGNPIIGGVVAGIAGLYAVLDKGPDKINAYKKTVTDLGESFQNQQQALDTYITNFDALSEAIANGSKSAIIAAQTSLSQGLKGFNIEGKKGLNEDFKKQLLGAKNLDELGVFKQNLAAAQNRTLAGAQSQVQIQEALDKGGGLVGFQNQMSKITETLADSFDLSSFTKEQKDYIVKFQGDLVDKQYQEGLLKGKGGFDDAFGIISGKFGGQGQESLIRRLNSSIAQRIKNEEFANQIIKKETEERARQADFKYLVNRSISGVSSKNFQSSLASSEALKIKQAQFDAGSDLLTPQRALGERYSLEIENFKNDFNQKQSDAYQDILKTASGLLEKNKTQLTYDQSQSLSSSFAKFGETGDVNTLTKELGKYFGPTEIKELQDSSAEQLDVLQKQLKQMESDSKIAAANYQAMQQALRDQQRMNVFGAGNPTESIQAALGVYKSGLGAQLTNPYVNKFNDPKNPGFGSAYPMASYRYKVGPTNQKLASENYNTLTRNADRGQQVLAGIDAGLGAGLFGFDVKDDSPIKKLREQFKDSQRRDIDGALTPILQKNQLDTTLADFDTYSKSIVDEEKKKLGYSSFANSSKDIKSLIGAGKTDEAISKLEEYSRSVSTSSNRSPDLKVSTISKLGDLSGRLSLNKEYGNAIPEIVQNYADKKFAADPITELTTIEKESRGFLERLVESSESLSTYLTQTGEQRHLGILMGEKNRAQNKSEMLKDYDLNIPNRYEQMKANNEALSSLESAVRDQTKRLNESINATNISAALSVTVKGINESPEIAAAISDSLTPIISAMIIQGLKDNGINPKVKPSK